LLLEARGEFDEALEEFRRGAADGDDLARKAYDRLRSQGDAFEPQ
jgi:hypothetical protein